MTTYPTVRSVDQDHPPGPEPAPLAQYLAAGAELLDGERLCWCEHLEGDHLIGEGRCTRWQIQRPLTECGCDGFRESA